ncbi:hypothetical protein ABIB57_004369 [Devosia sp. UYZn731]|uniref:hypothetical protein n=1 Tax=Devosia sp. UYZn731 TaxID=3156345 RepID=UPI003399B892
MSWYQATLNRNGIQSKLSEDAPFVFFDPRPLRELHAALWAHGYMEVEHVSTEGNVALGKAILRDPHVIAIEKRLDLDLEWPKGLPSFEKRPPPKKLKLMVVAQ